MTRPTAREFAARWREFHPTSAGVLAMTLSAVMCNALLDWPVWACAVAVIVIAAAWSAFLAALELSNEAADRAAAAEPEEEGNEAEADAS